MIKSDHLSPFFMLFVESRYLALIGKRTVLMVENKILADYLKRLR
jgi:hypothetical protein